ncbi:hypothetical protein [Martelella alba]|uniref:hypothetical protein n=1 Tax=Martelella alba TaxID=2590451 RepID=UPI0015E85BF1|nr:hypothetical protein [Martelella alba]
MQLSSNLVKVSVALAATMMLTSCLKAPTYGTGTTATTQLMEDLGAAVMLVQPDTPDIDYDSRPGLVEPPKNADTKDLAQPVQSAATTSNSQWLESPEQQRQRLYAEAEAHKDDPSYRSPLLTADNPQAMSEKQQLEAFRKARADAQTIDITQTKYLIDPPSAYRQPSSEAALNDLGEPERKKEARRKKLAEGKNPDKCFLFMNCTYGSQQSNKEFLAGDAPVAEE